MVKFGILCGEAIIKIILFLEILMRNRREIFDLTCFLGVLILINRTHLHIPVGCFQHNNNKNALFQSHKKINETHNYWFSFCIEIEQKVSRRHAASKIRFFFAPSTIKLSLCRHFPARTNFLKFASIFTKPKLSIRTLIM